MARHGRRKSLLFNGHLDTNPVTGGWMVDPFGGLVDDRFVYGIGVSNMKAGDAAYFMAVRTLIEAGVRLAGDVLLSFVVGELQGGIGTVRAIEQGLRADCFINAEPTDLGGLTLHAGAFNFEIELHGVTRHLSKREEAVDAILAAVRLIPRLTEMRFEGAATPAHAAINRAHVGIVRGALTDGFNETRPPQVADFCRLAGAARYAPSQTIEGVLADIGRLLSEMEADTPGLCAVVYRAGGADRPSMPPFEADLNWPIVATIAAAYQQVRGQAQPQGALRPYCYYGTDAAHLVRLAGMPGIVCGPGGKFNTMPDERVAIDDYLDMICVYMLGIIGVCKSTPSLLPRTAQLS